MGDEDFYDPYADSDPIAIDEYGRPRKKHTYTVMDGMMTSPKTDTKFDEFLMDKLK